jgi:hypothetical protein
MKRTLVIVLAGLAVIAGVFIAIQFHNESQVGSAVSDVNRSVETARLNEAYLNWVKLGNRADGYSDAELLGAGYAVCEAQESHSDTVIEYNLEESFPHNGRRIIDGARQYLC